MQIFLRIIKTAWHGFWRNGWLSLVAIFIMTQVLLLVGLFILINVGVNQVIQKVNDSIDVAIFFKDYVPDSDILGFKDKITAISGVKSVRFVSRKDAMERYIKSGRQNPGLLEAIGNDANFFPASLELKVAQTSQIEEVAAKVLGQDQNKIVSNTSLDRNKDLINKLRRFNYLLAWGDLGISLILMIVALLIIFNTIRITIFTRREEIEIMKLVGATDWYIRWPLILEGTLYGFIGAILALLLTLAVYYGLQGVLGKEYWSIQIFSDMQNLLDYSLIAQIFVFQLFFGVLVGSISSYLATKRHLRI